MNFRLKIESIVQIYWAPSPVIARSEIPRCASEQAPQSREGYEIATPRQVGARNDKERGK